MHVFGSPVLDQQVIVIISEHGSGLIMEVGEVVVDIVTGSTVSVHYLHPVRDITVLMRNIRGVVFFEYVISFIQFVFSEDLVPDLLSQ
jgi:hypothetical protein